ncbi:MAG: D-alanine--D-alanine ligase [Clostridiales bacterium]|nr:D-alanine--D-alanine ligase [Clostridiales bacterium]
MMNIAVFFGGRTCEHDVSIVTGVQAMENMDRSKYNVLPIYLHRDGLWYTGKNLTDISIYENFDASKAVPCRLSQIPGEGILAGDRVIHIDAALLCMHGMHGEDGTLQGMLELCDIPYTSAGVGGSAAGMDKALMKKVFLGCGFPTVPYVEFLRTAFELDKDSAYNKAESTIGYPCYVKPASLGSSIGITKANDRETLIAAMDLAFSYDRKVIVERGVENPMEINCSVLGGEGIAEASLCEKPMGWEEFLTFEDKYMRGAKGGKGSKAPTRQIPADIGEELTGRIQTMAVDIFNAMDCKGVVRIDFLVNKESGELFVNEINTIPGSLAFYLWEPKGVSYSALLDRLIAIALKGAEEKRKNSYAFESALIESMKGRSFATGGVKGAGGKLGGKF